MSTWFFSNLTYPQISSPFLFFAFSFVSIQDLSFFTSVTSLFVSFGLVTHVVLAFFHFRHFSFLFHLDLSLVVHAFMRRYFSVCSRVSILSMRPCAAIFLSAVCFWWLPIQTDCWWPDCMPRWWWLIAWWNDILTNWLPFHRPTLLRKTTGVQNVVLTPKISSCIYLLLLLLLEFAEEQYLLKFFSVQCSTMFRPRLPSVVRVTLKLHCCWYNMDLLRDCYVELWFNC